MGRGLSQVILGTVAALLILGSPVGTQVPTDVFPLFLASTEDLGAFHASLVETKSLWSAYFAAGGILEDLRFRPLIQGGGKTIYWGSIRTPLPTLPMLGGALPIGGGASPGGTHAFAYVHTDGSDYTLPPDQLFHAPLAITPKSRVSNRVALEVEYDFLVHVLAELIEADPLGPFAPISAWFFGSASVSLCDFALGFESGEVWVDLTFRDTALPGDPSTVVRVTGTPIPGGFDSVTIP